MASDVRQYGTQ